MRPIVQTVALKDVLNDEEVYPVTVEEVAHAHQISTDSQAFLEERSRPSERRKRTGIRRSHAAGILPSDDHILDFALGYYDADPVAEAFVQDAYIDGNSSHGRAMLDQALAQRIEPVANAPASMVRLFDEFEKERPGSITIWSNGARSSSGVAGPSFSAF
jgi:hypothetical protein